MNLESSFGMIAKNRRRELGLTQDELARRVGCAPITVRKIEADDLRPSVQIAERMAMALNIPLEERAAFVKLARIDRTPVEEPKVTPMPAFDEIGSEDLSGRAIRGYALGERLGNGGMGVVYRAVQPLVEREVAIKIILPQYANHPDFIRRFEAEAQLVARLEHPHIVPLYDYWREPSVAYLIMRLLRGGSVQSLLRNGTALTPEAVLRMMEQIGSALSSAHRAGVVHRDLKPANVLLDEDNNAYLADFGIAKNLRSPSSDTQADMVIGSPDYISPEQIKSEFVRPQTDIYALGVMLYELLTGRVPFHGPTPFEVMHQHLSTPLPALAVNRSGLPKALDAVIEHATAKDPLQRYETVDMLLDDLRKALSLNLREIKSNAVTSQPTAIPLTPMDNPYKGLRAFGEGDAQDFYGREALTQQLLVRLGEGGELARFLAVVGPSGSGKSSVVKAGLIPALRRGALPGSENWFIVEMLPSAHPLEELEAALLRVAVNPPASLMEQFQKDSRGLIRAVRRSLPNDPNIELVLVIDQFEEVFTLLRDEKERLQFLELLVSAMLDQNSRVRVVLTLRADFIDRPLNYVDFGELLHQRMELVLPLTPDELESAITAPAERVGFHFETGLLSAILHDLGDQPGTLPLLQYALTELYEKRAGNTLTKSAYREIGGVLGALGRRAEEIFTGLDTESQTLAKQLFLRLVTLGEGVEDTRRRALIAELENLQLAIAIDAKNYSKSFQKVLDSFGKARLLSFDRDPDTRGSTVEVAHEAIIREWTRLRDWLNESRTLVRMQRQLAQAAAEWEGTQHDESFLLTGTKLAQYEGWTTGSAVALTQRELDYLKASVIARGRREVEESARQQRELESVRKLAETERSSMLRLRKRNQVISIVGVIALVLAVLAGILAVKSNENARQAQANIAPVDAQRLAAEAKSLAHSGGDPQLTALLSISSINLQQTLEGDSALIESANLSFPRQIFLGHTDQVWSAVFSPDGKSVATGGLDGTIRLWDAQTGKQLQVFQHSSVGVVQVDFSPDNKHILASDLSGKLVLWNIKTGLGSSLPFSGVWSIAFSPNGEEILTGAFDGSVHLMDIQTKKILKTFKGHTGTVTSVAFAPDGKTMLTGSQDRTARLWDIQTGQTIHIISGHADEIYGVAFSPDGRQVLTGSKDQTARLWDVQTGKEVRVFNISSWVYGVAFSPDGKYIATAGEDKSARIWESKTSKLVRSFTGFREMVSNVAFSPDGKYLLVSSWDKTAQLLDVNGQTEFPQFTGHAQTVNGVAFSPDEKYLFSGSDDGTAKMWDISTGDELHIFEGHANAINILAVSPNGKYLLTGSADDTAWLWNIQTGEQLESFQSRMDVMGTAFSPDGQILLVGDRNNLARLWDVKTGKLLQFFLGHSDGVFGVAFSPDGKLVLTGSWDKTARLWDAQTGKQLQKFIGHTDKVNTVAFSPDGKYVATAGFDKTARLWDTQTSKEVREFTGHMAVIWSVAFSPDGKYLLTGSADNTARLWNVQTGEEVRRFIGHTSSVWWAAFSPDGQLIATASGDRTIRLWDVDYHDTVRYLCSRLLRDFTDEERAQYSIKNTGSTCPKP